MIRHLLYSGFVMDTIWSQLDGCDWRSVYRNLGLFHRRVPIDLKWEINAVIVILAGVDLRYIQCVLCFTQVKPLLRILPA